MPKSKVAVVVSDAHLGHASADVGRAFHRFLEAVPDIGDHLLINGDLFEFWFAYRSVIPKKGFPTLAALAALRKAGVELTVTGGNHDRWGANFWKEELGASFHRGAVEIELAGWNAWVAHGDGKVELDLAGRALHAVTAHPLTARIFQIIHPDVSFWLVRRMSRYLAARKYDEDLASRAAVAQEKFVVEMMNNQSKIDLAVLGHTHVAALRQVGDQRWYLNPGAWLDGYKYAVVTDTGPELRSFV